MNLEKLLKYLTGITHQKNIYKTINHSFVQANLKRLKSMSMTHQQYDKHQKAMATILNKMGYSTTFKPPPDKYNALHKTNINQSTIRQQTTWTKRVMRSMHELSDRLT